MNKSLLFKYFRLFIAIFSFSVFLPTGLATAWAQQTLTLHLDNERLETVINAIERQSRYLFLNNQVDLDRKTTVHVEAQPITNVLDQIFSGMGIDWKIAGTNIYI